MSLFSNKAISCRNCSTKLYPDKNLKIWMYGQYLIGTIFGIAGIYVFFILNILNLEIIIIYLLAGLITEVIYDSIFYKTGRYIK